MYLVYDIFGFILFIGAIYTAIPDLFLHRLGIGCWKSQYTEGVVLTFDDGPNPEITPQILDILDDFQVKAIFFITGMNAARYPKLVKEIQKRGHQLGAHSLYHRYAWFQSPLRTWHEWEKCVQIIENLTTKKLLWVRPPWGTFNLVTWLWIKTRHKQAVLWNVEGHDWRVRQSPEKIAARVLRELKKGSIIVLHDAGGEKGATKNTVKALSSICSTIVEEKELPIVKLELVK